MSAKIGEEEKEQLEPRGDIGKNKYEMHSFL